MPKDTPSMAKNKIKRSLAAICDPHPSKTEVNKLWDYFEACCAYCGNSIQHNSRIGHLDHLIPSTDGGSNNIHNHALSCARCNGDEKREESWKSFLERKTENSAILKIRRTKIEIWIALAPETERNEQFAKEAEAIIQNAVQDFERSVERMRELRANSA